MRLGRRFVVRLMTSAGLVAEVHVPAPQSTPESLGSAAVEIERAMRQVETGFIWPDEPTKAIEQSLREGGEWTVKLKSSRSSRADPASAVQAELRVARTNAKGLAAQRDKLQETVTQLGEQLTEATSRASRAEDERSQARDEVNTLQKTLKAQLTRIQELQDDLGRRDEDNKDLRDRLDRAIRLAARPEGAIRGI